MIDLENINDVENLTGQELQYRIYILFTQLARRKENIRQCEQIIAMLNTAMYKLNR